MNKFERVLSDAWLPMQFKSSNEVPVLQRMINQETVKDIVKQTEQAVLSKLAEQGPVMYARTYYGEIDWDEACVTEKNDGALMHATDMRKEDFVRHGYEIIPLYAHPCVSPASDKPACVSESGGDDNRINALSDGTPEDEGTIKHLSYIKRYQKWRRGEDKTMDEMGLTPKQIGEALDWLIGMADDHIADKRKKVPDGWQLAPIEPTDEMWGGLARKILLAFDFNCKTPESLIKFLGMSGFELPDNVLNEPEMKNLNHVISKGTRAVILYKAMLAAAPKHTGEK